MTPSRPLFGLLSLLLASASVQAQGPCQVSGTITGLGNQAVVFRYQHQGKEQADTVRAQQDRFTYQAKPSDDGFLELWVQRSSFTPFWGEPGRLTITGTMADAAYLTVRGTAENNTLNSYNQTIGWPFRKRRLAQPDSAEVLAEQRQQRTRAFIAAHPQARTSAYLLRNQTVDRGDLLPEYEQLEQRFSPAVRASVQGQEVRKRLTILRQQPLPGRQAPAFTIPDTAGVATSLSSFEGRYVLLDFWGHWCGPCVRAMPQLKQLQAHYGKQVALIGIAMEQADDKRHWQQAIRQHEANWTQLSELKAAKGVIEQYNVTAFPTYILLDKQGKVVARASDLALIEAQLKALPRK